MEAIILAAEDVDVKSITSASEEDLHCDGAYQHQMKVFRSSLNPIRSALMGLDAESYLNLPRADDMDLSNGRWENDKFNKSF